MAGKARDVVEVMQFPAGSVGFDADAFDAQIQAHGVDLVHFRAVRNPVGLTDRYDSRRPDGDQPGASNGNIYIEVGCFVGLLVGNSKEVKAYAGGLLDSSTAQITAPRFYDDGARIYLKPEDRLFLREPGIQVIKEELVDTHTSGIDRLRFPVSEVLDLVDNSAQRYRCGADFDLTGGVINWGSRRPGVDPATNKGRVYSVVYLTRPYWYVARMLHELRVAQTSDELTGVRGVEQMPQAALIYREYVHRGSEEANPDSPDASRQPAAPDSGGFGPR